jgi:hypothetical protein
LRRLDLFGFGNSHFETDFGVSSAGGAGNTKIGFLKARRRRAFKKPILIVRIAVLGFMAYTTAIAFCDNAVYKA